MSRIEGKDFLDLYYLMDLPHKHIIDIKKQEIIKKVNLEEKQIKSIANIINHYIPRNDRPNWSIFLEELKERIKKY